MAGTSTFKIYSKTVKIYLLSCADGRVNCIVNIFTKNEYTKMAYAMPIRLSVAVF
jgi:hypothetical protein